MHPSVRCGAKLLGFGCHLPVTSNQDDGCGGEGTRGNPSAWAQHHTGPLALYLYLLRRLAANPHLLLLYLQKSSFLLPTFTLFPLVASPYRCSPVGTPWTSCSSSAGTLALPLPTPRLSRSSHCQRPGSQSGQQLQPDPPTASLGYLDLNTIQ